MYVQLPRGTRGLIFGVTIHLLPYFKYTSSESSDKTGPMPRLIWAFVGRLCNKYQNLMCWHNFVLCAPKNSLNADLKILQEYHQCQTVWIQIRPDKLSGLIWVQTGNFAKFISRQQQSPWPLVGKEFYKFTAF